MADDLTREAQKIWNALRVMVDQEIDKRTASCVRSRKMTVMTAPNGETVGVAEPFGQTIDIPYSSALANVKVGDTVWVDWKFNNASTMVAMSTGEGQIVPDYFDYNEANRNLLEARKFIQSDLTVDGDLVTPTAATVPMDYDGVGSSNYYIHVSPSTEYRLTLYDTRSESQGPAGLIAQYNSQGTFISLAASGINWRSPQAITFTTNENTQFLRLSLVGFPKYRWKLEQGSLSTDWQPSPEDVSPYTFDTAPTNNSKNPITSGGVYNALATKVSKSGDTMTGALSVPTPLSVVGETGAHIQLFNTDTSDTSNPIGDMFINNSNRRITLRAKATDGYRTDFNLPAPDGTSDTSYNVITSKGGTMTGNLVFDNGNYKGINIKGGTGAPSINFYNTGTRLTIDQYASGSTGGERYLLPIPATRSSDAWYDIITSRGGTMTGDLTVPNAIIKGSASGVVPAVMGRNQNGQSLGTIDFLTNGQIQIRSYLVGVGSENYKLPAPTTGAGTEYQILTTKNGVFAFKDQNISVNMSAGQWSTFSITQFVTPTGYYRIAIDVVGGSNTACRSYAFVMANANANWLTVYASQAINGTIQVRATYMLATASKEQ